MDHQTQCISQRTNIYITTHSKFQKQHLQSHKYGQFNITTPKPHIEVHDNISNKFYITKYAQRALAPMKHPSMQ